MDILDRLSGAVKGAAQGFSRPESTRLDNRDQPLAMRIIEWQTNALVYRDQLVNSVFGPRFSGRFGGAAGLVRQANNSYLPRAWENPPYNYPADGGDNVYLNYPWFFGNIQQVLPVIAPPEIKLRAIPRSAEMTQFSVMVNALLDDESEYLKLAAHVFGLELGSKLYGFQCGYYSSRQFRGPADIQRIAELCDPLSIVWEPGKSLEDAKYVIYAREILIEEATRAYAPDFQIMPERLDQRLSTEQTLMSTMSAQSKERCVEIVAFIRDFEEVEEPEIEDYDEPSILVDEAGEPIPDNYGNAVTIMQQMQRQKMVDGVPSVMQVDKYPHGREVRMINKKIVMDVANPDRHKLSPFKILLNHPLPNIPIGIPEWLTVGDVPNVINECMSAVVKGSRRSFGKTVIDRSGLVNVNAVIDNDPDETIEVKANRATDTIHNVSIGGLGSEYFNTLTNTLGLGDRIQGVNDSSRGIPSPSVTSGKQQQSLTDQSTQRLIPHTKRLETYLGEAGTLILNNAAQYRNPAEVVAITSTVSGPMSPQMGEQLPTIGDLPERLDFKTKMTPYIGLPSDRQERLDMLLKYLPSIASVLQTLGPEMADAIVKLTDVPELEEAWELTRDRILERQAMAMQQQAMQIPQNTTPQNTNGRPN